MESRAQFYGGSIYHEKLPELFGFHFGMEESGEQCTVVFVFIVTEPASKCVCMEGGGSVTIYAKTTVDCSRESSMNLGICSFAKQMSVCGSEHF